VPKVVLLCEHASQHLVLAASRSHEGVVACGGRGHVRLVEGEPQEDLRLRPCRWGAFEPGDHPL